MLLYDFWRSSAAYRVRIVLNLKKIEIERSYINLAPNVLAQNSAEYRALNPQGFVPMLVMDNGTKLTQSYVICEYLDAHFPEPRLIPNDPLERADVLALALSVACDIHPLNNARVLRFLKDELRHDQETISKKWYAKWVTDEFTALEKRVDGDGYCRGSTPTLADVFLIPQVYNARRFDVDLSAFPRICKIVDTCNGLEAFADAAPEQQPDAAST
ncbi:MAG: maleylacetoacetate isomerase [Hyphomicrobiales bacterium]